MSATFTAKQRLLVHVEHPYVLEDSHWRRERGTRKLYGEDTRLYRHLYSLMTRLASVVYVERDGYAVRIHRLNEIRPSSGAPEVSIIFVALTKVYPSAIPYRLSCSLAPHL